MYIVSFANVTLIKVLNFFCMKCKCKIILKIKFFEFFFQVKLTDRRDLEFAWLGSSKLLNRRKSVDPAKIRDFRDSEKIRDGDNLFGNDVTTSFTSAAPNLVK